VGKAVKMLSGQKKEQFSALVKQCIDLYLTKNIDFYGYCHVIDVNMSEDLKTAFIYISYPVEKNGKKLENNIVSDNKEIVAIFNDHFRSKFIPKLRFIFIKECDVEL